MADSHPQNTVAPLSLCLFGPFHAEMGGRALPRVRSRKGHWLLALLVLRHGNEVDRAWLAGTLWPDSTPSQSMANLRNTLRDLRRALGPQEGRLLSPGLRTLALDLADARVDLLQFDAAIARGDHASLQEAVSLYRGPLLEECTEAWVLIERQAREQAYLQALETLAAAAMAAHDPGTAAKYLHRAVTVDPLRETAHRSLMEALAVAGSYAAALEIYRNLRLRLHRETNTEPDPETQELHRLLSAAARQRALPRSLPSSATAVESGRATGRRHNLPCSISSFVGRERQIADLKQKLTGNSRLVTITGPGGCGKTRLALEVAGQLLSVFVDGIWLVELADLTDAALLPQAVSTAIGVVEESGCSLRETLIAFLRNRHLLLVLDNCEHLLTMSADLVTLLLRECALLCVLATSREPLGITGERQYRVSALSLPERDSGHLPEHLDRFEAIQLFLERAQAECAGFRLTAENAPQIVQICRQLDGLPLAIELAAARVGMLPVAQIAARLTERFRLLRGGRTALPRHQTLRALIDWSYDLLSEPERALLRRLSVFRGGWTLEAAEAVCAGSDHEEPECLDWLISLVQKSLVLYEEQDGVGRYRLLETIRQYAHERLRVSGEEERVGQRHRDFFLQLAEDIWETGFPGSDGEGLDCLESDRANLQAALEWSLKRAPETALRLAAALGWFWWNRGYWSEGRQWIDAVLARAQPTAVTSARAWALYGSVRLAGHQGDYAHHTARLEELATLFRMLGDRCGLVKTLAQQAHLAGYRGDPTLARKRCEEAIALARELGDPRLLASALSEIGVFVTSEEDAKKVQPLLEESVALADQVGNRHLFAWSLALLARCLDLQGDAETARAHWEQTLELRRKLKDRGALGWALLGFGSFLSRQGDEASATSLLEECLAIGRDLGSANLEARALNALAGSSRRYYEEAIRFAGAMEARSQPIDEILSLGRVARERDDYRQARRQFSRCLLIAREFGKTYGTAQALEEFASLAARQQQWTRAVTLLGAAEALCRSVEVVPPLALPAEYERVIADARAVLGSRLFTDVWIHSQALTLEQVICLALDEPS